MPYFTANVGKGDYVELTDRYFGRPPKELRKVYAEALKRLEGAADLSLGDVVARDAGKKTGTPVSEITAATTSSTSKLTGSIAPRSDRSSARRTSTPSSWRRRPRLHFRSRRSG